MRFCITQQKQKKKRGREKKGKKGKGDHEKIQQSLNANYTKA